MSTICKSLPLILSLLLGLAGSGCSKQLRANRHLSRGDRAFQAQKYDEAEIEYLKVLQLTPLQPVAVGRLGLIYQEEGRLVYAHSLLQKAAEFDPADPEVRLKLALNELALGDSKKAVEDARLVLAKKPGQAEALELIASSAVSSNGLAEIQQQIERLRQADQDRASYHAAFGTLELRRQDFPKAEADFKHALELDPKSSSAFFGLASVYWARKDVPSAEQAFRSAADLSDARSITRLKYAQFKYATGKPAEAKQYLEQISAKTPDYLPAWDLLAEIAFEEKRYDDCGSLVARVLVKDSINLEAMMLNGKLKLVRGDAGSALASFRRMASVYSRSPQVLFQLARAYLLNNDTAEALTTLNEVIKLNPDFVDAVILRANLNIRKGDLAQAISSLEALLKQQPYLAQAYLLLIDAHLAKKEPDQALAACRRMSDQFPKSPEVQVVYGSVLSRENQLAEARQAFERALTLYPGYLPAIERLVDLDIFQKQFTSALARGQAVVDKSPSSAEARVLLARVHIASAESLVQSENQKLSSKDRKLLLADVAAAQPDINQAETNLLKATDLDPNLRSSYLLLSALYQVTGKQQKALERLNTLLSKTNDVVALLQVGMIQDSLTNYPAARDAYEKLLTISSNSVAALNNLAFIYSERMGDNNKALSLAEKAHQLMPNDPLVADTLGWILYRKADYARALNLLQESVAKLPNHPDIQLHLGMTLYTLGDEAPAGIALEQAVNSNRDLPGKDAAAGCLAILAIDPKTADAAAVAVLEKQLQQNPRDSIALNRLGAIQERDGALDRAVSTYQSVLKAAPRNSTVAFKLAQLYASPRLNDPQKAVAMAKTAHDLAPDNARISAFLGHLVYRSGDYKWAANLLEDSAQKLPDDPQVNFDLAWAYYSLGRVDDALPLMQKLAGAGASFPKADEAARFVSTVSAASSPSQASAFAGDAQKMLGSDPNYVPALMVCAVAQEALGAYPRAAELYNQVLSRYPQFSPAIRNLGLVYFARLNDDQKAYDLVSKAREALPQDAEVGKALGVLAYRKGNYSRAAQLLKESAQSRKSDAELLYYLGMAQYKLKAGPESKATLQQALAFNLPSQLADNAKRVLAELK